MFFLKKALITYHLVLLEKVKTGFLLEFSANYEWNPIFPNFFQKFKPRSFGGKEGEWSIFVHFQYYFLNNLNKKKKIEEKYIFLILVTSPLIWYVAWHTWKKNFFFTPEFSHKN